MAPRKEWSHEDPVDSRIRSLYHDQGIVSQSGSKMVTEFTAEEQDSVVTIEDVTATASMPYQHREDSFGHRP